ncbi:MAG: methyltransferase domain-containing protein [Holophagales bacterium]|nr:methyltransferase domain-containing protein [Holophagales bacterium]
MSRDDSRDDSLLEADTVERFLLGDLPPADAGASQAAALRLWRSWAERSLATRRQIDELRALLEASPSPEPGGGTELTIPAESLDGEDPLGPALDAAPRGEARSPASLEPRGKLEPLDGTIPSFGHRGLLGRWLAPRLARMVFWLARPLTSRQQRINAELDRDLEACRRAMVGLHERLERSEALLARARRRLAELERDDRHQAETADRASRLEAAYLHQQLAEQGIALAMSAARASAHSESWALGEGSTGGGAPGATAPAMADEVYFSLQERFRGSRELVRARLAEYLPRIEAARCASPSHPLLDLGCGRGEWLELLAEHGHTAVGVDSNPAMVKACRDLGLDATCEDLFRFLASKDGACFGAVTSLHVVEHLPFTRVLGLLGEIRRMLRPGGLIILESPNPHSLPASAMGFHCDPTHERPIPPELLAFAAESLGFVEVEILPLAAHRGVEPIPRVSPSAAGGEPPGGAETATGPPADVLRHAALRSLDRVIETVNAHLLAPPDYAVVARRPLRG